MCRQDKLFVIIATILTLSFATIECAWANSINLPKDANGWTIFTPSSDTLLVYVRAGGNDTTGKVYHSTDAAIGSDPFHPKGPINAFATYAAAFSKTRNGYPDWILLKRGNVFFESIGNKIRSGRSETKPSLIAAYGDTGDLPILKTGDKPGINMIGNLQWAVISGISFYAHTRNPNDPNYVDSSGRDGVTIATNDGQHIQGILIEGCKIQFYTGNQIGVLTHKTGQTKGIAFRRNVVLDNYSTVGHSQGLWAARLEDSLFEENIFDHNGWLIKSIHSDNSSANGQATMFNHNTYFANAKNITFRNNIFSRPSQAGNKWTANGISSDVIVSNNLYYDSEVGMVIGGNYLVPYHFRNFNITDNVIINTGDTRPTQTSLAWEIRMFDTDATHVKRNLLIHNDNAVESSNSRGILLQHSQRDAELSENIIYDIKGYSIMFDTNPNLENVTIQNNDFQEPVKNIYTVRITSNGDMVSNITWRDNRYYNGPDSCKFLKQTNTYNLKDWKALTGDNSLLKKVTYPEPGRNIIKFQQSIGKTASKSAFIANIRSQSRFNWDSRYTAPVINDWLRAGFSMPGPSGSGSSNGDSISTPTGFTLLAQ